MNDLMKEHATRSFDSRNYNTEYNTCRHEERPKRLQKETVAVRECILSHKNAIRLVYTHTHVYI